MMIKGMITIATSDVLGGTEAKMKGAAGSNHHQSHSNASVCLDCGEG
jgi:hypothetical protein